ncbi:hypothetical protein vBEliSR6L_25 [Erythrobacter phage vB_EliS_R6L]|nr:hypothetical protein vBEliSR6L_25 [Erythrobacter phage vB_EliS_R6L]
MAEQTNGAEPAESEAVPPLRDEIAEALKAMRLDGTDASMDEAASVITHLLNERGHYLPGCPPAAQILQDAQQFAGQFMLAMLCVRLLRMLNTRIVTQETKGLERWLNDYIDGKNHGPVGKPMFWPGGLPGLAQQLRDWGYAPTETRPQFVARAKPQSLMTMQ